MGLAYISCLPAGTAFGWKHDKDSTTIVVNNPWGRGGGSPRKMDRVFFSAASIPIGECLRIYAFIVAMQHFFPIYISRRTASSVPADAEILRARWRAELRAMPSCRYISRALYYSHCQRFAPATYLPRVAGDVLTQYRRDSLFVIFYRYRGYIRNSSESC